MAAFVGEFHELHFWPARRSDVLSANSYREKRSSVRHLIIYQILTLFSCSLSSYVMFTMISQLPKACKIIPLLVAVYIAYLLVVLVFPDTRETVWPQGLSHSSRTGIRDEAFTHISNTTLGVSIHFACSV